MKINFGLLAFIALASCSPSEKKIDHYSVPQKSIIAGKIITPTAGDTTVHLWVNRLGQDQEPFVSKIGVDGSFRFEIETYLPTDASISYQINFLMIIHPGDSIKLNFNGTPKERVALLKTVTFSGDRADINSLAAQFQEGYFKDFNARYDAKEKMATDLDPKKFRHAADSLLKENKKYLAAFLSNHNTSEEFNTWAELYLDRDYYSMLSFYPGTHREALQLTKDQWDVSLSYYDYLNNKKSISDPTSAYALSSILGLHLYRYIKLHSNAKADSLYGKTAAEELRDSLLLRSIPSMAWNSMAGEIEIAYFLYNQLEKSDTLIFKKNKEFIDQYLTQPFLKEPLLKKYTRTKIKIDSLQTIYRLKQEKILNNDVISKIISSNKGQVVYIDVWATWCGPCREEFPYYNNLIKKAQGVKFVYICIDSKKEDYENLLKRYQLSGSTYFLNDEQTQTLQKDLDMNGVPRYVVIDKNGEVVLSLTDIRPSDENTAGSLSALANK